MSRSREWPAEKEKGSRVFSMFREKVRCISPLHRQHWTGCHQTHVRWGGVNKEGTRGEEKKRLRVRRDVTAKQGHTTKPGKVEINYRAPHGRGGSILENRRVDVASLIR